MYSQTPPSLRATSPNLKCPPKVLCLTFGGHFIIGALAIHALVTLYLHTDYCLLATDGKAYKIPDPAAVLEQMRMTALRASLLTLFCFYM